MLKIKEIRNSFIKNIIEEAKENSNFHKEISKDQKDDPNFFIEKKTQKSKNIKTQKKNLSLKNLEKKSASKKIAILNSDFENTSKNSQDSISSSPSFNHKNLKIGNINSLSGLFEFIHFNSRYLWRNRTSSEITSILHIIKNATAGWKSSSPNSPTPLASSIKDSIQSSVLNFLFKLRNKYFNNFFNRKLIYEMKLETDNQITNIIKKNGGECPILIKVTSRNNKNGIFFFI